MSGRKVKVYGCARRGCDAVNEDWKSYGAYGKSWCLGHKPLRGEYPFDVGR
jgi:hypothetical protein